MSISVGDLTGAGAISNLGSALLNIIGRYLPDPQKAAELAQELVRMQSAERLGQMEVNKAEASNPSVFIGGWRPAIGWVCAAGMAYQFLVIPLVPWTVNALGGHVPPLPTLDGNLWELITAMLGIGGLRTFEKVQGVASGNPRH